MNQIIIPISPDPISAVKRKLHFTGLQIKADLNMLLTADVVYYADDNTTPMMQAIEADELLTTHQKRVQLEKFRTVPVKADTTGVWVNAQTGDPVELVPVFGDANNPELITDQQPPAGAIPEIIFWQNIPLSVFLQGVGLPAEMLAVLSQIKFADLLYGAVQQSMNNMDTRKRF